MAWNNVIMGATRGSATLAEYLSVPHASRTSDRVYQNLKFFAGLKANRPTLLVKSDAAKELTNAVEQLGWLSEPSLENKWPHSSVQERSHGITKRIMRACMLQSGVPMEGWDSVVGYASTVYSANAFAPM